MRLLPDGTIRYSPRDLIAFLEGDFAAWCDRNAAEQGMGRGRGTLAGNALQADGGDEEAELVMRRGLEHEAAHLATLKTREPGLVEIATDRGGDKGFEATTAAMHTGAPIIFQGELRATPWMGLADFLHRVDGPSTLGDFHYEPWDTKLARTAKPYFMLQLCAYAEMLQEMQGVLPAHLGFILGDGSEDVHRSADVWHYYQRLKQSFEQFQQRWNPDDLPDPALDRTHGRWSEAAAALLEHVDDLSLVAGISRSQIVRLRDAGIDTVADLAKNAEPVADINSATLQSLRAQAAMQVRSRTSDTIAWAPRASDPERPRRGLALLPPPSPNDVFFDIEGFPYAPGGLEYLLGVVTVDSGTMEFRDWWAHGDVQEKRAFEEFMDWAYARWKRDPTLHIYHYASYERSALSRLMGKYATREFEVDQFLRHHVLVDLYPVVLQGVVIGAPSYSLKKVESLYRPPRTEEVTSAGGSVVEYQKWIDSGQPQDYANAPILDAIREYNKVDCESTVGLRDWLLARQAELGVAYVSPPGENDAAEERESTESELLARSLHSEAEREGNPETKRLLALMAHLLEFHRREEKPFWWKYFERMDAPEEQLFDDMECIAGLVRTDRPLFQIKRSQGWEYRFDPDQETKLHAGNKVAVAGSDGAEYEIDSIDCDEGIVALKAGPGKVLPDRLSIVLKGLVGTRELRAAIRNTVALWASNHNVYPALADLLARRAPRLSGAPFRIDEQGDLTVQAIDIVRRLDRSTLCMQGPPGTGKTTIAAEIVLALLADGKRVGIVSNSHAVGMNLLERIAHRTPATNTAFRLVKCGGDESHALIRSGQVTQVKSGAAADAIVAGPLAIAGTAWLFARPELVGTLDYLFIEEAGQFSLANAVAVAASARSLILLGDQMQLAQPLQGSHPGESGGSVLEYFLQDAATIPAELGIFLGTSWRMHPDVCRVVSDAWYEGRLHSAAVTHGNRIVGAANTSLGLDAGVRFVPIAHNGRTQSSAEEVDAIAGIVKELLGCTVELKGQTARPMTMKDIVIVAPFNMQVRALKQRLGAEARVGSVDKFQGQEAAVVILSMCASTLDDAPRGPEFLLSPNRLNVAISRAQALAIVVGSPELGNVRVRSVAEMKLVSGWCRVEVCGVAPNVSS